MCNAPGQCGSFVVYEQIDSLPLPATGGTIVDGTYVLTKIAQYTGPGGATGPLGPAVGKETFVFSNGTYQETRTTMSPNQPPETTYGAGDFSTAGTTLQSTVTCPGLDWPLPPQAEYSASPTGLRSVVSLVNQIVEEVLLKID